MIFIRNESIAARRRFPLFLVDAVDGITPVTTEDGEFPEISKNGGAYAATTNPLVHIANGDYYVELTQAELDTAGMISIRYLSVDAAKFSLPATVAAFDMFDTAPGGGQYQVEVTALADSVQPLPNTLVTVRNSDLSAIVAYGRTNSLGKIIFALDPGTYKVLLAASSRYTPIPAQTLTVDGNEAVNYSLASQPELPPPSPSLCRVTATVIGLDGLPKQGVTFTFTLLTTGSSAEIQDSLIALSSAGITKQTDGNGKLDINILRSDVIEPHVVGATRNWRITSSEVAINFERYIDSPTLDLGILLPLSGGG